MKTLYTLLILLIPFVGFGQEYIEIENSIPHSFDITSDERLVCLYQSETNSEWKFTKFHLFGDDIFNTYMGSYVGGEFGNNLFYNQFFENNFGNFVFLNNGTIWIDTYFGDVFKRNINLRDVDANGEPYGGLYKSFDGNCDSTNVVVEFGEFEDWYETSISCVGLFSLGFYKSQTNTYNILYEGDIEGYSDGNLIVYSEDIDEFDIITLPFVSSKFSVYENDNLIILNDEKILKIDNNFNTIFMVDIPDDFEGDIISTSDGGALLFGKNYSSETLSNDFIIHKLNNNGELLWTNQFGGYNDDEPFDAIEKPDGNFIIVGKKTSDMSSENSLGGMWIVELNSVGDTTKSQTFGQDEDYAKQIRLHPNGNYYILGKVGEHSIILTYNSESSSSIEEYPSHKIKKKIKKITNLLGQEIPLKYNSPMFYIYDDGSVEKKIIIE